MATKSHISSDLDIQELLKDKARLDWLADSENLIGGVVLPGKCVKDNVHILRDAIDEAMTMYGNRAKL